MSRIVHSLTEISVDRLSSIDLRKEAEATNHAVAYRAVIAGENGHPEAQVFDVLVLPIGRIGIACGGDAKWADILEGEDVEQIVNLFCTNPEWYDARN